MFTMFTCIVLILSPIFWLVIRWIDVFHGQKHSVGPFIVEKIIIRVRYFFYLSFYCQPHNVFQLEVLFTLLPWAVCVYPILAYDYAMNAVVVMIGLLIVVLLQCILHARRLFVHNVPIIDSAAARQILRSNVFTHIYRLLHLFIYSY